MTTGRQRRDHLRAGLATGEVLLSLAMLALVAALVYPGVRSLTWRDRVDEVAAEVEAVAQAVRRHWEASGRWPSAAPSGEVPAGLAAYLPPGFSFRREGFAFAVERWERVESTGTRSVPEPVDGTAPPDSVEAPVVVVTEFAGLTVRSGQEALLAALLERYGPARSFVRDSTWTWVLPTGG